ncbi:MAG: hypothetical protein ACUVTL_07305 [Thermoproteota archaeon]
MTIPDIVYENRIEKAIDQGKTGKELEEAAWERVYEKLKDLD